MKLYHFIGWLLVTLISASILLLTLKGVSITKYDLVRLNKCLKSITKFKNQILQFIHGSFWQNIKFSVITLLLTLLIVSMTQSSKTENKRHIHRQFR